jgi:hypothetical protein
MASGKETRDHDEIRKWAEERDGHPARVKGTGGKREGGLLRIDFGEPEDSLEEISWDEFFEIFDERGVTFLYSPEKKSRFNKFVYKEKAA